MDVSRTTLSLGEFATGVPSAPDNLNLVEYINGNMCMAQATRLVSKQVNLASASLTPKGKVVNCLNFVCIDQHIDHCSKHCVYDALLFFDIMAGDQDAAYDAKLVSSLLIVSKASATKSIRNENIFCLKPHVYASTRCYCSSSLGYYF